jgi:hypothetical protein
VTDGTFLRVFTFEPSHAAEIDSTLRDHVLQELCEKDGILEAYAARRGPGDIGERVIATVWRSREAMDTGAVEADIIAARHTEYGDGVGGSHIEALPVAVRLSIERQEPARILRILWGEMREGGLDGYVEDVRQGAVADGRGEGLICLYLGIAAADRFVTVSAWTGWDAIEAATGGNLQRPIATRFPERVKILEAGHYEILPDTSRPLGPRTSRAGVVT